ncbi:MAG: putative toxin-antitoxin system toxin component, PIN family, partial [Candidatus Korobacteraceae bacterium]
MRIVLDTTILVRATEKSQGLARELLVNIVASKHTLLLSTEMLYELARVLRYPRLREFYGLSEERVYDFVGYLQEVAEIVPLSPLLSMPIRDVNDIVVLQTAVIGEADILCTRDEDFYDPVTTGFLSKVGIAVMDDIALMH